MNNEQKTVQFINYDYIINELIDSMNEAIEKMKTLVDNQTSLADYLDKAEDKEKYAEFIDSLKKQNNNYEEQIRVLTHRIGCLELVKASLTVSENEYLVAMLLEAIGVANKEGKTFEERKDNHEEVTDCGKPKVSLC